MEFLSKEDSLAIENFELKVKVAADNLANVLANKESVHRSIQEKYRLGPNDSLKLGPDGVFEIVRAASAEEMPSIMAVPHDIRKRSKKKK